MEPRAQRALQACTLAVEQGWIEDLDYRRDAFEVSLRKVARDHDVFLQDGETYDTLDEELIHAVLYDGGAAAVAWLIANSSEQTFWVDYYEAIPKLGWEGAFEQAFGTDLPGFYANFRAYMKL